MTKRIISILLSVMMVVSVFGVVESISASAEGANLLTNPGAETGDFTGWTDASSEKCWKIGFKGSIEGWEHPAARSGKYYFITGWPKDANGNDDHNKRYLYQDVSIAQYVGKILTFSAYLGGYGHMDYGSVRMDLLDSSGKAISSKTSEKLWATNGDWKKQLSVALTVPKNAVTARVFMIGQLTEGSEADAYFDDLSLTAKSAIKKVTAPKATKITKIKVKKSKTIYVKWKKIKGVAGYQIQHATTKKKIKKNKGKKTFVIGQTFAYLTNPTNGKHFFRVRCYKLNGAKKVFSKWSKIKFKKYKK